MSFQTLIMQMDVDMKRRAAKTILFAVCAFCMLTNSGCTSHRIMNPSREDYLKTFEDPDTSNTCSIAVIEFDDQGDLWDSEQLSAAVEHIEQQNEECENGAIFFIYIHGWKQNASWESGRLSRMKDELIAHAAASKEQSNEQMPVIGIYIAWRGSSTTFKKAENITFWNRISAAARVSSLTMTETLIEVKNAAKQNPKSKCVVMGHSMGGLILEQSLSQLLLMAALEDEAVIDSPVDLVVTIGSVTSALRAKRAIDAYKRNQSRLMVEDPDGNLRDADAPLMISITSETDIATGSRYPLGQWFATFFERFRTYDDEALPSQKYLATHAVGHVPLLRSHTAEIQDGQVVINVVENRYNTTPLWVMQVPDEILSGHSDVISPLMGDLINQLVIRNNIYDSSEKLKLIHESPEEHP